MSHSPAPWTIDQTYEPEITILAADGFPVADVTQTCIMPGYSEKFGYHYWAGHEGTAYIERSDEEVRSNIVLMNAAPDLLVALKRLATAAANRENTMGDPCRLLECQGELRSAIAAASAAIAKAEKAEAVHDLAH